MLMDGSWLQSLASCAGALRPTISLVDRTMLTMAWSEVAVALESWYGRQHAFARSSADHHLDARRAGGRRGQHAAQSEWRACSVLHSKHRHLNGQRGSYGCRRGAWRRAHPANAAGGGNAG